MIKHGDRSRFACRGTACRTLLVRSRTMQEKGTASRTPTCESRGVNMLELKPLHRDAIPAALAKAERYRLLNEPWQAESICQDVLRVDPENETALVTLILALTDQFHQGVSVQEAREVIPRLRDDYERAYYSGVICERRA